MSSTVGDVEIPTLVLHLSPAIQMTDDQFYDFCRINRDLRIERTAAGDLLIMPPAGGTTGNRNAEIVLQLQLWAKKDGQGMVFDSSTGFRLPNGAVRSPDASWVRRPRLARLSEDEKEKFLPLCPDFVIELRSPSDAIGALHEKMDEYLANGARVGWLIDPKDRRVFVYDSSHRSLSQRCLAPCTQSAYHRPRSPGGEDRTLAAEGLARVAGILQEGDLLRQKAGDVQYVRPRVFHLATVARAVAVDSAVSNPVA